MKSRKADQKLAVACLRVSTTKERQALGLEAQKSAIERWAARECVTVASWHRDEMTGGAALEDRLGLVQALADVKTLGAGVLVFQKVDRFTRDGMTQALVERQLAKCGAELAFAEGGGGGAAPTETFMRDILVATAKLEKSMIRARIRAALAEKQERGEMTGKPPYGWKTRKGELRAGRDGAKRVTMIVEDQEEQKVVRLVVRLSSKGKSARAIIAELTKRGMLNRAGHPFHQVAIRKIIARSER